MEPFSFMLESSLLMISFSFFSDSFFRLMFCSYPATASVSKTLLSKKSSLITFPSFKPFLRAVFS